jgi:hypothetical protein
MNVNFIKDEDEKLNRFPVVFLALFIARRDANEESRMENFHAGNFKILIGNLRTKIEVEIHIRFDI